jgi:hypothetical protein
MDRYYHHTPRGKRHCWNCERVHQAQAARVSAAQEEADAAKSKETACRARKAEGEGALAAHIKLWGATQHTVHVAARAGMNEEVSVATSALVGATKARQAAYWALSLTNPDRNPMHGRAGHGVVPRKDTVLLDEEHPHSTAALPATDCRWRERSKTSFGMLQRRALLVEGGQGRVRALAHFDAYHRVTYKRPLHAESGVPPRGGHRVGMPARSRWGYAKDEPGRSPQALLHGGGSGAAAGVVRSGTSCGLQSRTGSMRLEGCIPARSQTSHAALVEKGVLF